ncbi:MAG: diguanylate cyclase [Sneathiella sp.]
MSVFRALMTTMTGVNSEKLTNERISNLFTAENHSPLLTRKRAIVILSRIRLLSLVAAIFFVTGILLDTMYFDGATFKSLVIFRCISAFMLLLLIFGIRKADSIQSAYRAMFIFFSANLIFQALFQPLVLPEYFQSIGDFPTAGYAIFPFLIAACISIFPLSIKETFLAVVLFLVAELLIVTLATDQLNPQPGLGILVSLVSACALCSFSAISQLSYMVSLVEQASIDSLTNCFSRNSGEEILDVQFRIASRQNSDLTLAFLDIDDFKFINDKYGHEAGDRALSHAADLIRRNLRDSDILVRWGGEEFLMILPHTDAEGAARAVRRLRANGLGNRPDNTPLTASIGIADLQTAKAKCWEDLVELADEHMYIAKTNGKNDFSVFTAEPEASQIVSN